MDKLTEFLANHPVLLGDGAMGTMLQAAGLEPGANPEAWNITHPEAIKGIYHAYIDAGANAITANSFGANRYRLSLHDLEDRMTEINRAAASLAREVAGDRALVAGSMGPTGEMLEPLGTLKVEAARQAYAAQAAALAEGGVDFFLIETMSSLEEVQAAIEGIRSVSDLPIAVTMTFDKKYRTMMGVRPTQALDALYNLGIRVIGANCGNGPAETEHVISEMAQRKPEGVYLMAQSNAGLPRWAQKEVHYDGTPEVMAAYARRMRELGVSYIGACCGSTPAHISAMQQALATS